MRNLLKILSSLVILAMVSSCIITESIVFNDDMSGIYKLTYDLSEIKDSTAVDNPEEVNEQKIATQVKDTMIVFNDLLEQYKDSIAALPIEQQKKLQKLKGLSMHVVEDESSGVFVFSISKAFESIDSLTLINERVEEAMSVAMTFDNNGAQAETMKDSTESKTKAIYSFEDNVFKRIQPKSETWSEVEDEPEEDIMEDNQMAEDVNQGMEEMTKDLYYVIHYTFPKKIKSISNENATISEDGKSFELKLPWDDISKNEGLLNLEIELED